MNEEIEQAIKKIQDSIAQWDILSISDGIYEEKTTIAKQLQLQLTVLKLIVGIDSFDELPTFSRYLKNVTKYINRVDEEEDKKCN